MAKNKPFWANFTSRQKSLTQKGVSTKQRSQAFMAKPSRTQGFSVLTPFRRKNLKGRDITLYTPFRVWGVILRFMLRFGLLLRLSRTEVRFDPEKIPKSCLKRNLKPQAKKSHRVRFFVGKSKVPKSIKGDITPQALEGVSIIQSEVMRCYVFGYFDGVA
ncbi:MAG: hypothetical protein R3Y46_07990 [Opitutales bacterium]